MCLEILLRTWYLLPATKQLSGSLSPTLISNTSCVFCCVMDWVASNFSLYSSFQSSFGIMLFSALKFFFYLFILLTASEPKDADIIWTSIQVDEDTKKVAGIRDEQYINQFPFEACLVMKHHLAETIQKVRKARSSSCRCQCQLFFK